MSCSFPAFVFKPQIPIVGLGSFSLESLEYMWCKTDIAIAPDYRPQKDIFSSNHQFSGDMLVFRGVTTCVFMSPLVFLLES